MIHAFGAYAGFLSGFTTEEKAQEVSEFFQQNPVPMADRAIKQAIEGIQLHAAWIKGNRAEVATWFKENNTK
jgi:hypothetical protein